MAKGSAAEVLWTGNDARFKAIRNNLVRKLAENLENIKKLTKEECLKFVEFQDPAAYADAGKAVTDAFTTRMKEVGITPAEVAAITGTK